MALINLINLDQLIEEYAWRRFVAPKRERKASKIGSQAIYQFQIDKARLIITDAETEHRNFVQNSTTTKVFTKAHFINKSSQSQECTFAVEESLASICVVKTENGWVTDGRAGISLAIPNQILALNPFQKSVRLTNVAETTASEAVKWSAKCKITVPSRSQTLVQLAVEESNYQTSFSATTRLYGTVTVAIRQLPDRNQVGLINASITDIITDAITSPSEHVQALQSIAEVSDGGVSLKTTGTCIFQLLINEKITVNEGPVETTV